MMEIKFRGKRKDNGEWAYGFFSMQNLNHGFVPVIIQFDGGSTLPIAIVPDTVGQFTGIMAGKNYDVPSLCRVEAGMIKFSRCNHSKEVINTEML